MLLVLRKLSHKSIKVKVKSLKKYSLLENKAEILKNYVEIIQALTDTSKHDKESTKLQSEMEVVIGLLDKC